MAGGPPGARGPAVDGLVVRVAGEAVGTEGHDGRGADIAHGALDERGGVEPLAPAVGQADDVVLRHIERGQAGSQFVAAQRAQAGGRPPGGVGRAELTGRHRQDHGAPTVAACRGHQAGAHERLVVRVGPDAEQWPAGAQAACG